MLARSFPLTGSALNVKDQNGDLLNPVSTALRSPGASAVIYGGIDAPGIAFEGVDEALSVPQTELRLFGKPESYVRRRMGVALSYADHVARARELARHAAGKVASQARAMKRYDPMSVAAISSRTRRISSLPVRMRA